MAARLTVRGASDAHVEPMPCHKCPALTTAFRAERRQAVILEKLVTVYSSRETDQPASVAQQHVARLAEIDSLLDAH
ncbi:MAG TPA: hypothetical protein VM366_20220 [Anaerolineae bacterium]|nr:hypothetical protein [Anaerolineae bacterium]